MKKFVLGAVCRVMYDRDDLRLVKSLFEKGVLSGEDMTEFLKSYLNEIVGLFDVFLANRRSDAVAPVLPVLSDLPAVMRKKEELAQSANNAATGPVNNVSIVGCSMCSAHKEAAPQ